jgi:hypothetical protein
MQKGDGDDEDPLMLSSCRCWCWFSALYAAGVAICCAKQAHMLGSLCLVEDYFLCWRWRLRKLQEVPQVKVRRQRSPNAC